VGYTIDMHESEFSEATGIKRSYEDVQGLRIKDAGLYVIVEEVAHFAPSRVSEAMLSLLLGLGETWWGVDYPTSLLPYSRWRLRTSR
jgi:hypothetical protein